MQTFSFLFWYIKNKTNCTFYAVSEVSSRGKRSFWICMPVTLELFVEVEFVWVPTYNNILGTVLWSFILHKPIKMSGLYSGSDKPSYHFKWGMCRIICLSILPIVNINIVHGQWNSVPFKPDKYPNLKFLSWHYWEQGTHKQACRYKGPSIFPIPGVLSD